ncbi:PrgI family protein [Candidatus Daviesbacteria bacterium]|nr:PrgI family protein [Candidatus Daviesbacteria bacterium]
MEPHPIPQNITSFQFKLIGDMTLKQFIYLATGVGIAYLTFIFLGASIPIIAWPVIISSSLLGVAFAFLPVGYRSLDHWMIAFMKAVYSPTKRGWKKSGKDYKNEPLFNSRLSMFLQVTSTAAVSQTTTQVPLAQPSINQEEKPAKPQQDVLPSSEELQKTVELAKQAQDLQNQIVENERKLTQIKVAASKPSPIPVDYSQEIKTILENLNKLLEKASAIKNQLSQLEHQEQHNMKNILVGTTPVRIVAPSKPKQTPLTLTSSANVINGIVKDAENNYLEGVVVVVYDKEGLPVRALKTNKLGQFSSATPLPNGTYTVELEKENLFFDALQMELAGEILPPLMIAAKRGVINS